jgi:hypothetical protein
MVAERPTTNDASQGDKLPLPPGYELEHGAGVLLLRRADGSVAAVLSATDVATSEVVRTAEDDYRSKGKRSA